VNFDSERGARVAVNSSISQPNQGGVNRFISTGEVFYLVAASDLSIGFESLDHWGTSLIEGDVSPFAILR
jgi:hypothetical protein